MNARPLNNPFGGLIVAHEDITGILRARRGRSRARPMLNGTRPHHTDQIAEAHEQLGQSLTAISLAAVALREGGNVGDAITLISLAVEEARLEIKRLRHGAEADAV